MTEMEKKFKEREAIFRANGIDCGYPPCCIDAFVDRAKKFITEGVLVPLTVEQEKASNHSGFIPCACCAKKIIEGTPLESLIKDRLNWLPEFPNAY
jgi:hypothetical protein